MDGYLSKPIRPEELRRAIADLIPAAPAGAAPPPTAGPAEPPSSPILDRAGLLARVGHNPRRLCRLAAVFQDACPGMLQAIRDALRRGDAPGLGRAVHTLKGSVGSLGATAAFLAAESLEALGRSGDLSRAAELLAALDEEVERFQAELVLLTREETP
jgi:HPt (histidine-containing phosphotransfer) domain-containing protein